MDEAHAFEPQKSFRDGEPGRADVLLGTTVDFGWSLLTARWKSPVAAT
jgi:hypothetical protein